MISEKMAKALNGQTNAELYSSYLYLAMSSHFAAGGFKGFAYWMKVQALEELYHAMKLFDYVQQRGGPAELDAVDKPPKQWSSPQDVFEHVFAHEQKVTGLINGLVAVAESEGDKEAADFLQWFVKEQEEEEESAGDALEKVKKAGDGDKLKKVDAELGGRTFKIPRDVTIKFRNPPG